LDSSHPTLRFQKQAAIDRAGNCQTGKLPKLPNIADRSENILAMKTLQAMTALLAMNIDKRWTYFPPVPPFLCVSSFCFSLLAFLDNSGNRFKSWVHRLKNDRQCSPIFNFGSLGNSGNIGNSFTIYRIP
jgi:hypothetical protein